MHPQVEHIFLDIAIILLLARVLATLAAHFRVPAVLGELVAGLLLGPSVLGWIEVNDVLELLAKVGVTLLLFEVGLETDFLRLVKTGRVSATIAVIGFTGPLVLAFIAARYVFNLNVLMSLFIAGTLTATGTGIIVRMLSDVGQQKTEIGQYVLGAILIDDLLGILLLVLLYDFAQSGGINMASAGRLLVFTGLFIVLAPLVARLALGFIERMENTARVPGVVPTTVVAIVLLFAAIAQMLGVPEIIGGFAAGLAISRRFVLPIGAAGQIDRDFAHRIEKSVRPIIHLFTSIFFAVIGLSINVTKFDLASPFLWAFIFALTIIAVFGKLLCGLAVKGSWAKRLLVGTLMVPRGEVGLIFAGMGLSAAALVSEVHSALVLVIAVTTLIPPLFLPWIVSRANLEDPSSYTQKSKIPHRSRVRRSTRQDH
jgi:Kef-type K+ transport system membrane component KefB